MLVVGDVPLAAIESLLARYGLTLQLVHDRATINGSYWGDREAGIRSKQVFVRSDTPLHSLLHEACHIICMSGERRAALDTDAGGDDLEEAAVCYLQLVLADEIDATDRAAQMRDMDTWGYSFRLGSTRAWFEQDAEDARKWLIERGLLSNTGKPVFRLRA